MNFYTMRLRPVSTFTLPDGMTYELVALPRDPTGFNRPDLPRSEYQFGEFTLSPEPTQDEMERFDIAELPL